jgi:hypothetical protein
LIQVNGSPGNDFFAGHAVGVPVGAEFPDAYLIAQADPARVSLRLDRVPHRIGRDVSGQLDAMSSAGEGIAAHGRFAVPLCEYVPDHPVPANAPNKAISVGTAIARLDDDDHLATIDLFDQSGLTCATADPTQAQRQLWEIGNGSGAQPATLSEYHSADHFTDTVYSSGWVRLDKLALTIGAELRATLYMQDTYGKPHLAGTLRATVCGALAR